MLQLLLLFLCAIPFPAWTGAPTSLLGEPNDGSFILSIKGPGGVHDPVTGDGYEVTVVLETQEEGQEEPECAVHSQPIPEGTTPAAAAAAIRAGLQAAGVPAANITVTDATVIVTGDINAGGVGQTSSSTAKASGVAYQGAENLDPKKKAFKKKLEESGAQGGAWVSNAANLRLAVTGFDSASEPAVDSVWIVIPAGLTAAQVDALILTNLNDAGWVATNPALNALDVFAGATVVDLRSSLTLLDGDPGFLAYSGIYPDLN